ncbi:transcription termination factor MTERF8, chloroplastic [Vigna umbellata]|uniref:transcription termination factor MTERF8, chloroplastic n=1 Tax=Vigna umbellata TaxID=87088 RepID=UPI001F5FE92E|nr:transcription termination factor MTERF8, chloroplastic [Vigna umbellata]
MVLPLALFGNCWCSCSSTIFCPFPLPNPPSRYSSTFHTKLQPQPQCSLAKIHVKPQLSNRDSIRRCRSTNSLPIADAQAASFFALFQEIGIGFEETRVLFSNNPDLTSVSVESLRARLSSLRSLDFDPLALGKLITKRPTVLTDNQIDPLLTFLRDELQGKLEKPRLNRLLSSTEQNILASFPQKVRFLVDRGIPVDQVVHVLNKVSLPKVLCGRSVDEIDRTLAFFEPFGGIDLILKRPQILNHDLDAQIIPRVNVLMELSDGDVDSVGKVLVRFPLFLNYSVEHVEGHVGFLSSFAELDYRQIFRIIQVYPAVVTASRERKLRPRIQFLKDCGLDSDEIFKFLIKAPTFLSTSFRENIAYKLVLLVKIGYRFRTKDFSVAVRSATRTNSMNMQKVIGMFLNYGFSCEEIVAMSKKHPQILQYNHASLEMKMEYLIEEMGRDTEELLVFPAFLGYKLDDRIKHRYEVKKSVRGAGMSINKLLSVSEETFTGKPKKAHA